MVAGATGLVGREVLAALLTDKRYRAVHTLGRNSDHKAHARLTHHPHADLTQLAELPAVNDVYIALGTTIKLARSESAFRAIDFDAVIAIARAARANGATRLAVVSAMGADPKSRVFYSRVKGEMEAAIQTLGYSRVVIARPSLLVGDRAALAQPSRAGERIGQTLLGFMRPLIPANYRAISAAQVAAAMIGAMRSSRSGTQVLLSGQMQQ